MRSYRYGGHLDQAVTQPRRRRVSIPVDWFGALCAGFVFVRLIYSTKELSYDFAFYERFVTEIAYTTVPQFFERILDNAPYYFVAIQQGPYNYNLSFELGFAALAFFMTKVLPVEIIIPVLASISIYVKISALRAFGVPTIILVGLLVFFIAILETNALRSGMAQAIALAGFLAAFRSGRVLPLLVATVLAASLHLSSLAVTLVVCGSWVFFNRVSSISIRPFRIIAISTLVFGVTFSTPWVAGIFSRIDVYSDSQANDAGGFSLLKLLPLVSLALSIAAAFCAERLIHIHSLDGNRVPARVAISACCAAIAIIFGSALYSFYAIPVISARLWQLSVPFGFIPCALSLRWRVLHSGERFAIFVILLFSASVFIYQFMFRYVLTNFFNFLIGHRILDLGQCASGLCV